MGPTSKEREKGGRGGKGTKGRQEGEGKGGKGKGTEGKNVLPHVKQAVAAYDPVRACYGLSIDRIVSRVQSTLVYSPS